MPTIVIMEFNSTISGGGVYPLNINGNSLDFSTGTLRTMDINDEDSTFDDFQTVNDPTQTSVDDFTHSGGTITAGAGITSAGKTLLVSSDGLSRIYVGYIRDGFVDNKNLLFIEEVSGTFDPNAVYTSTGSTNYLGSFAYTSSPAVPCFTRGTRIRTAAGLKAIEEIKVGDLVFTRDNGLHPVRWIGSRKVSEKTLKSAPNLIPIRIAADAIAKGLPHSDLTLSPQHRVLIRSAIVDRMTGNPEVLSAVKHLTEIEGIAEVEDITGGVEYFHILFDHHQVVFANGLEVESLLLGPEALKSLDLAALTEIFVIFPNLKKYAKTMPESAAPILPGRLTRKLVSRHLKNGKPLVNPTATHTELVGCQE